MGRLVQPAHMETVKRRGGGLESTGSTQVAVGGDGFADRIAKYIPGEVLAGYMALDRSMVQGPSEFVGTTRRLQETIAQGASAAVGQAQAPQMSPAVELMIHQYKPMAILIVCLVLTPLYIRQTAIRMGPGTPWHTHAMVATLAFLVWAYAMQGSAFMVGPAGMIYQGSLAAALLALFTMVSGLFEPMPTGDAGAAPPSRDAGGRAL